MDIHKVTHDILIAFKEGHLHLPLFAGLFSVLRNRQPDLKDEINDMGDLGDNVPAILIMWRAGLPVGKAGNLDKGFRYDH